MAAGVADKFFCLSKTLSGRFLRAFYPSQAQVQIKGTQKNPVFTVFLGLKDFGGFKDRQEVSRFQVLPRSQFL